MFESKVYKEFNEYKNLNYTPPSNLAEEAWYIKLMLKELGDWVEIFEKYECLNKERQDKIKHIQDLTHGLTKEQVLKALNISDEQ
jgi:hypothetical protein